MRFLITGTAGFIGFHLARRLIADGHFVCGVDGMTPYYDVTLKQARHAVLARSNAFTGHIAMLEDFAALQRIASGFEPEIIVRSPATPLLRFTVPSARTPRSVPRGLRCRTAVYASTSAISHSSGLCRTAPPFPHRHEALLPRRGELRVPRFDARQ